MNIKPCGNRIALIPEEPETKTKSGLIIPSGSEDIQQKGKVIAIGEGEYIEGNLVPLSFKINDIVIYGKHSGTEIELNKKKILIIRVNDILARID